MIDQVHRRDWESERRATPRAEEVFKPVALPALAAALRAARPRPPETPRQDLPPFLRKKP
jgi:hypothetical protein